MDKSVKCIGAVNCNIEDSDSPRVFAPDTENEVYFSSHLYRIAHEEPSFCASEKGQLTPIWLNFSISN